MHKILKYAAIAGILSLIILIPWAVLEILKSLNKLGGGLISLYIFVLFVALILYVIFVWGFKIIGEKYQNNLLKIASFVLIAIAIIYHSLLILALISPAFDNTFIQILPVVLMGAAMIPFGIGLLRLKMQFGSVATATGVIEIISGISFLTVLLSLIGALLFIPNYILLVIILFKAVKKLETSPAI